MKIHGEWQGIIPIVAGTFDHRGDFDAESFDRLIRHLLQTGVNGLTLFGLATEFYKLTDAERQQMMEIMLSHTRRTETAGIVSITHHSFEVAVRHAREAERLGADGLMILPPYFLSPSPSAILRHVTEIARATSLPIIVQYAPSQTGVRLGPEVFVQLQETCGNIRYVKVETQPPGRYAEELQTRTGGRLKTFVGYAGVQMPDALNRGVAGIQPGCSFAEVYVALYRDFLEGKRAEMEQKFHMLLPYISYWMQNVELIIKAEKVILHRRGIIASDYCRFPNYALDGKELQMIDAFLEQFHPYFQ
jgi:4-hydroxy-tetrahydrodipicolinate synthase